jgi:hypothetical protein
VLKKLAKPKISISGIVDHQKAQTGGRTFSNYSQNPFKRRLNHALFSPQLTATTARRSAHPTTDNFMP